MATGGSILVIRGGAIGDFILTLPALRALREAFPKARLTVLGYPHIAELAVAGGLADEARPIEARPMTAFFTSNGRLPEELAAFFGGFDVILSYLYDPDAIFERNVRRCSAAQWIRGPHRPSAESGAHAAECFLKPLERLAVFDADPTPRLRLPPAPSAAPGPALAAHPGSGSPRKNWPAARWAELLARLSEEIPHAQRGNPPPAVARGRRGGRGRPGGGGRGVAGGAPRAGAQSFLGRARSATGGLRGLCRARLGHYASGRGVGAARAGAVGGDRSGGLAAAGRACGSGGLAAAGRACADSPLARRAGAASSRAGAAGATGPPRRLGIRAIGGVSRRAGTEGRRSPPALRAQD